MPKNMDAKKTAGDVVKSDKRMVKVRLTPSSGHRRSRHLEAVPARKEKDRGKYESKPMLVMCRRLTLGKLDLSPVKLSTPHPPDWSLMNPAWMAAPQMKESAR
jgi:hypothetical protein